MKTVIFFMATFLICSSVWALDDTPENRTVQAQRHIADTLPELFDDLAEQISRKLEPSKRQEFKDLIKKSVDLDTISNTMEEALVKHFSADELEAMADFYSSPIGKSAMKKFPAYYADFIQTGMPRVIAKIKQDMNDSKKKQ